MAKYRHGILSPARKLENRCVELANRGMNSIQIGEQLNVNPKKVSRAVSRAASRLEALGDHEARIMRRRELATLDEMQAAIYGQAIGDEVRIIKIDGESVPVKMVNLDAIQTVLKIQKQRMCYIPGLEVPKVDESNNRAPVQISVNYVQQGVDGKPIVSINATPETDDDECHAAPLQLAPPVPHEQPR